MPLGPGTYDLVHNSSPEGYGLIADTRFTVSAGNPTQMNLTLDRPASLSIRTLGADSGGSPLPAACYRLYADRDNDGRPDGNGLWQYRCDNDDSAFELIDDGVMTFPHVSPGSYLLKQENPPDEYARIDELYPITLAPGEAKQIDIVSQPINATLTIYARGDDKGLAALPGACFDLHRDADGDDVYDAPVPFGAAGDPQVMWACDDGSVGWFGGDGVTRMEGIEPGAYFLVEPQAPAGYVPVSPISVTFTTGEQKEITVTHARPASIVVTTLRIRIGDVRQLLPGACYDLHWDMGMVGAFDPATDPKVAWGCDDGALGLFGGDGITELTNLKAGAYFLVQTQAPNLEGVGYGPAAPQAVIVAGGERKQIDVRNRYCTTWRSRRSVRTRELT
jgi:hypothetical protein